MTAYFNYRFAKRLKASGVRVRLVLDWFENQPGDRGLSLGFRATYPETPIVGYCGYIVSPELQFNIHPTCGEMEAGLIPRRLDVIGRALVEPLKEFCPELEVMTAPALRFGSVWRPPAAAPSSAPRVLVALPINLDRAVEILALLHESGVVEALPDTRFALKPHPVTGLAELKDRHPAGWDRLEPASSSDFGELLDSCDLLLGSNSSTCLEALARGIPVVMAAGRGGMAENPVPPGLAPEMWRLVEEPRDLLAALRELMPRDEEARARCRELGLKVRAECFEPVTTQGVRELFGLR